VKQAHRCRKCRLSAHTVGVFWFAASHGYASNEKRVLCESCTEDGYRFAPDGMVQRMAQPIRNREIQAELAKQHKARQL
jgi:hypothetical protein